MIIRKIINIYNIQGIKIVNFENYNKIYQEILDAISDTDISANYFLKKKKNQNMSI